MGAASGYKALSELCVSHMYNLFQERPDLFSNDDTVTSKDSFNDLYFREVKDFNTAGLVSHHLGISFNIAYKSTATFEGNVTVKVQRAQWETIFAQLEEIVKFL